MPSIRRSLITYFVLLLGITLAAVGFLVDRFAERMVRESAKARTEQIEQEYTANCQSAERAFDADLERQAEDLGRELRKNYLFVSIQNPPRRSEFERFRTGVAAVGGSAFWDVQAVDTETPGFRSNVWWTYWGNLHTRQVRALFAMDADEHPKYYQFHYPRSRHILAPVPDREMPALSLDRFEEVPGFRQEISDMDVGGERVRRIVYKSLLHGGPSRRSFPDRMLALPAVVGGWAPPLPPALLDRSVDPLPAVFVQAGRPRAELDLRLAEFRDQRDAKLAALAEDTRRAMTDLHTYLGLIGLLVLVAVPTGAWLLVGRGVAPIRKLSDAVSRVSEKDFHLPVRADELSLELLPIHDHLTQTLDELRRAFDREKQSVADISHELKTPLAALLTSVGVSLRKPRSAEEYKATLEECRDIGRQLSRLVDRIMTLASLDAGNDRLVSERVDASDVATECSIVIRSLAEAHGLTLTTVIDSDAEMVTDPDKLREVLNNLLSNAIEYNRPGGGVELRVAADRGKVTFAVRDTGIGMTPEVRAKIFERFYRADPSRTQTGVHAGLGLAIVREYVERLGGTITVESEPAVGSTFRVTLPTNGAAMSGGSGSVGRSGYTPSLAARTRSVAGAD